MEKQEIEELRANTWLSGKTYVQYDVEGAAGALRTLSASVNNPNRDDRDVVSDYEKRAEAMGLSFDNMTKDQQLAIINAAGREGPVYDAFISNAAYQVFTLAKTENPDIEQITDGFTGRDLTRISPFIRVFGNSETQGFSEQFDKIKDDVVAREAAQVVGQDAATEQ